MPLSKSHRVPKWVFRQKWLGPTLAFIASVEPN